MFINGVSCCEVGGNSLCICNTALLCFVVLDIIEGARIMSCPLYCACTQLHQLLLSRDLL
jgi:hypothetical protein